MSEYLTFSNIMALITLGGVVLAIYNSYKKPQDAIEKQQALLDKETDGKASIVDQVKAENKTDLLGQQVRLEREANERKFEELGKRIDTSMALAQNHIHTVDTKIDNLLVVVNGMGNEITRLSTIINERIPIGMANRTAVDADVKINK